MERRNPPAQGASTLLAIVAVIALLLGGGLWWWMRSAHAGGGQELQLTPEARQYVSAGHLPLNEVEMKATGNYVGAKVVEIVGKIGDNRSVEKVRPLLDKKPALAGKLTQLPAGQFMMVTDTTATEIHRRPSLLRTDQLPEQEIITLARASRG